MPKISRKYTVAIADDHNLLRTALANLVNTFENYHVVIEAENGKDLRNKIIQKEVPEIVMLDINMPEMDGFETTRWLHRAYPQVKVMALSMLSDEKTIINMFRLGAKGYLLKNADPEELRRGLDSLINKNVYLSEYVSGKLVAGLHNDNNEIEEKTILFSEREREFLKWVTTELAYKDIAEKMHVSPRSIDDLRQSLFNKLKVHSRVGLVMYAIRKGIVEL